jgi:hypothetical protein
MIIEFDDIEDKLDIWEFTVYDRNDAMLLFSLLQDNKIRFSLEEF